MDYMKLYWYLYKRKSVFTVAEMYINRTDIRSIEIMQIFIKRAVDTRPFDLVYNTQQ